jgi:hypothetical protein
MQTKTYIVKNNIEFATYLKWSMIKYTVAGDMLIFFLVDDSDNKFFKLVQDFTLMNVRFTINQN